MRILELRSRWQIAAVCATAFAVTVSLASWQYVSAKDGVAAEENLTGKVEVSVPATLLKAGKTYFVDVKVKNTTKKALEGPILLIVKSTSLEGLSVKNAQRTLESGESVFEIVADGKKLPVGRTAKRTKITFKSEKTLRAQNRRGFKLDYRIIRQVLRQDRESSSKQAGRRSKTNRPPLPTAPRAGSRSSSGSRAGSKDRRSSDRNDDSKNSAGDDDPDADAADAADDAGDGPAIADRPDPTPEQLRRVMDVQDRVTPEWLRKEGVVGTSTGLNDRGDLVIRVYIERAGIRGALPDSVQGIPVVTQTTGTLRLRQGSEPPPQGKNAQAGAPLIPGQDPNCTDDPKTKFPRPIPIGVSGSNINIGCSTGTIGCRVRGADGQLYALSNNHVFALENAASIGDLIVQTGPFDATPICAIKPEDSIGTLFDFQAVDLLGGPNQVDAGIALVTASNVGNATPCNGYGRPRSTTASAAFGMTVQKYGRTTGFTTGTITGLNVMFPIGFGGGTALFTNQIEITGSGGSDFSMGGDSGSLIVTRPGRQAVGLLFAGSGLLTFANPIDAVLSAFNVTIDGE